MSRQLAPASPLELLPPLEEPVEPTVELPELEPTVDALWLPLDEDAALEAEWLPVDEDAVGEPEVLWLPLEVELDALVLVVDDDDAEVDEAAVAVLDAPAEDAPAGWLPELPLEDEHAVAQPSATPSQAIR